MASKLEIWLFSVVLTSLCLFVSAGEYGVAYPQAPYAPPQPYYEKPTYYETYDTQVDYREANASRQCGILPAVHRNEYGYERDRLAFGEHPWLVSILDSYQVYLAAGAIITPRHILTSAKAIHGKAEADLVVRIGDYDILSDHNYLEAYKNYEISVVKIHHYHAVKKSYESYGSNSQQSYDQYNYDVAILELYEDIDFDLYPQAEPVCLPEYYYRSKTYYTEKTYSYGYGSQSQQQEVPSNAQPQQKTQIGLNADLHCWVAGWRESPLEKISFEQEKDQSQSGGNYGYSYKPATYYDNYEQSRTPRKAKVTKVYDYESYASPKSNYGYEKPYKTENWVAEYYYDACHADQGSPIFCLVPEKYEQHQEKYYSPPAYQPEYKEYKPSYQSDYQPSYQASYPANRNKRAADYYPSQQYQPTYAPPTPTYQKPYQPSYEAPTYQAAPYKFPTIHAEKSREDYRRAVVVGIVSYGTECTYTPYTETKKITVTPVKDILDWIVYVILTHGV